MSTLRACAVIAFAGVGIVISADGIRAEPPATGRQRSITDLIQLLDSEDILDRDNATRILLDRDEAVPALRRALKTINNPEGVKRARQILSDLANRQLERYRQYGRQGRVDVLVAWLGACQDEELNREKLWQAMLDAAWDILKRARPADPTWDRFGRENFPPPSYKDYVKQRPKFLGNQDSFESAWFPIHSFLTVRHRGDLGGDHIKGDQISQSLIACDGAVRLKQHVLLSIVFGTGELSGRQFFSFHHAVIVVDGDVRAFSCSDAVVVTRGNVRIEAAESNRLRSHIYAGGKVEIDAFTQNGQKIPLDHRTTVIEDGEIKEGVRRPLDFVRFFETTDVGIELSAQKDTAKVKTLKPGSPLEKAGLKVGDSIVSVDSNKTETADAVRRQLRRAFVSQEATVTVDREGKKLDLTVSFYGWELPKD
jgi:hypothetical protein